MEVKRVDLYDFSVALTDAEFQQLKILADKKNVSCGFIIASLLRHPLEKLNKEPLRKEQANELERKNG